MEIKQEPLTAQVQGPWRPLIPVREQREVRDRQCVFVCEHSLLGHLHVGLLAPVGLHTLVPSVDVHAGLRLGALVVPRLALVNVCGEEHGSLGAATEGNQASTRGGRYGGIEKG